jgi:hypothetical protein
LKKKVLHITFRWLSAVYCCEWVVCHEESLQVWKLKENTCVLGLSQIFRQVQKPEISIVHMYQGGIVQLALGKNKMNEINVVL